VFGGSSLDCNRIKQAVEHAWKGALLPKTAFAELVYGTASITADHGEVAGFLQKTLYGTVWAHLIAEAEDSGFLHPDGYSGQRFTESWTANFEMAIHAMIAAQPNGLVCTVFCSNSS